MVYRYPTYIYTRGTRKMNVPIICEKYERYSVIASCFVGILILILGAVGFHYYLLNSKFLKKSCEKYYLKWMLFGFFFSIVFCLILLEIFGKFEYIPI